MEWFMVPIFVASVGAIVCNVILIFAIVKFARLRNVVGHIIFAHFNVLQIVFYSFPISQCLQVPYKAHDICIFLKITISIGLCECLLLVLLITDWYIKTYKNSEYETFKRAYIFIIIFIYLLLFLFAGLLHMYYEVVLYTLIPLILCCVSYLVIINVIHAVEKRHWTNRNKFNFGLIIGNIALFSCFTLVILPLSWITASHIPVLLNIFIIVMPLCNPIFNLVCLYMQEHNFQAALGKIFTCQCKDRNENSNNYPGVAYTCNNPRNI